MYSASLACKAQRRIILHQQEISVSYPSLRLERWFEQKVTRVRKNDRQATILPIEQDQVSCCHEVEFPLQRTKHNMSKKTTTEVWKSWSTAEYLFYLNNSLIGERNYSLNKLDKRKQKGCISVKHSSLPSIRVSTTRKPNLTKQTNIHIHRKWTFTQPFLNL